MDTEVEMVRVVAYPDGRLNTDNAARFLGLSTKTLAIMRSSGTGPWFVKRGRVFYFLDDLQAWVAEARRVRSSAQARLIGRASCQASGDQRGDTPVPSTGRRGERRAKHFSHPVKKAAQRPDPTQLFPVSGTPRPSEPMKSCHDHEQ